MDRTRRIIKKENVQNIMTSMQSILKKMKNIKYPSQSHIHHQLHTHPNPHKLFTILLKFPSRGRPDKLVSTFEKYIQMADSPSHIHALITLDQDDLTVTEELRDRLMSIHASTRIVVGRSCGKIGAVNRDMDLAPPFDVILLASDDMIPQVKGYDTIIRNNMQSLYTDTDGVLFFNDGHSGKRLNTLCILGKRYYNRFGYIYNPEYKSLWCDNEFTMVANKLGKQTYIDQVIIKHENPMTNRQLQSDEMYRINNAFYGEDKNVFLRRNSTLQPLTLLKDTLKLRPFTKFNKLLRV